MVRKNNKHTNSSSNFNFINSNSINSNSLKINSNSELNKKIQ